MQQITFQDKVNINTETSIPEITKLTDDNINKMKQAINLNAPAGVISMYGGSTAPNGWLLCDGSAVSRTTYARLFSAIGTKYGAGNGSTTFNLPNFKGRVPVGLDSSQTEFNSLNKKGGSKYLQKHTHLAKGNILVGGLPGSQANLRADGDAFVYTKDILDTAGTGDSGNLQPYIIVNYIISY
jgi:microcystin-dependent protein